MREGRRWASVAAGGGLLMLVALAFDTSALLVAAVAFTALGLLTPAVMAAVARGVEVRRELSLSEVVEDEQVDGVLHVRAGPLGLWGAELEEPLAGEAFRIAMTPGLEGDRTQQLAIRACFHRRGRKRLPPPRVRITDPLHIAPATIAGSGVGELLVLPRTEPVAWRGAAGVGPREALEHGALADALAASDIDGLRPYRVGTPASRIHWSALARGAGLLERRLRPEQDFQLLVVLDCRCTVAAGEALDAAVRAAASLVKEFGRGTACGLLSGTDTRPLTVGPRLSGWAAAHMRLALVEPALRRPPLLSRRRPGALVYVAAQAPARLPRAVQESGGLLVLPIGVPAPGRWPVACEVAGCLGYSVRPRSPSHRPGGAPEPAVAQ